MSRIEPAPHARLATFDPAAQGFSGAAGPAGGEATSPGNTGRAGATKGVVPFVGGGIANGPLAAPIAGIRAPPVDGEVTVSAAEQPGPVQGTGG